MKRILSVMLCFLLLASCTGCAMFHKDEVPVEPEYDLYFRVSDLTTAAGADAIAVQASGISMETEQDAAVLAERLMTLLLNRPADIQLQSPFPDGTELRSVRISGGRAIVDLTAVYANLSGIELAMADYCITLTLTQIPEVRSVQTTVNGGLLAYRSSQNFTARDVLISSGEDVVATEEVTLYFSDIDGTLIGEQRELELYEGDTRAEALVAAMMEGAEDPELFSVFPEGFFVQSIWIKDDKVYVNLASSMLQSLPRGISMLLTVQALRSSLLSLENVRSVQFMVDGEATERLDDYLTVETVEATTE